jgi:PAS domain S-box-containing protein
VNRVPAGDAPRLPFHAAEVGVWEADLMTGEVRVSDRFAAMLGLPPGVLLRHRDELWARVHPDDRGRVRAAFEAALAGPVEHDVEYRSLGPDGQVRQLAANVVIFRDASGRPLRAIGSAMDITRRERPGETHARLAAIVEGSDDAVIGKSLDGIVTSWNQGAERIFGYTAEEMVGRPLARLVPPDRPNEIPSILAAIRRGERVEHFETERMRKDGERIQVSLTISPIRDATGNVIGASKIARDVTERKRAEEEREQLLAEAKRARAEAEGASRAKDQLLSIVSHELRTPLASMLGWVRVLRQGKVSPERAARALETIERSGRMQAELIEDLLDVSRIVTGRLRLNLAPVDLRAVAQAALDAIRPDTAGNGVRLEASLDAGGTVLGDTIRLEQVVSNLLNNAVKFTPAGGSVELRIERTDREARIVVRDTGRGITPEFLPQIFEPFRQADDVKTRKTGGLGLGLAIVRSLVEQHGGTLTAESAGEGTGSTFTVTLPLTDATIIEPAGPEGVLPPLAVPRLDGLHVLIVDDELDACEALGILLGERGAKVTMVSSVRDARAALDKWEPDVLVSDIRMPGEDGYALVRELRATERLRAVPAVAITGYHEDGDRVAAAGFHACLSKPVEPDDLVTLLASLAGRHPTS